MFFGDYRLAFAVGIALFSAGTIASCIGLLFPWLLFKIGKDPALGSGPVATIIQDVLSILIYFLVITFLLI
jgi:magnesium transporter